MEVEEGGEQEGDGVAGIVFEFPEDADGGEEDGVGIEVDAEPAHEADRHTVEAGADEGDGHRHHAHERERQEGIDDDHGVAGLQSAGALTLDHRDDRLAPHALVFDDVGGGGAQLQPDLVGKMKFTPESALQVGTQVQLPGFRAYHTRQQQRRRPGAGTAPDLHPFR